MALFDLFRKKTKASYAPANRLEELLIAACNDPLERHRFTQQLFHFDLLAIGKSQRSEDGGQGVTFAQVEIGGQPAVPVYTSLRALELVVARSGDKPQPYVAMPALALFQMLQNRVGIALNYGLDFGKHFTPAEIAQILSGESGAQPREMPAGSRIRIGIPAVLPEALVLALGRFAKREAKVKDLHFGLLESADSPGPGYLAVIDFEAGTPEKDRQQLLQELISLGAQFSVDKPLDVLALTPESALRPAIEAGTLLSLKATPAKPADPRA